MSEYTPNTSTIRAVYADGRVLTAYAGVARVAAAEAEFDRWLAAHDAEVRADADSDPAKDERLVRYMAMATPLGYQSALTVVQEMTKLLAAEDIARRVTAQDTEEPEWEYGTALRTPDGDIWDHEPDSSLAEAEGHHRLCLESPEEYMPDECIIVKRIPGREAGPWLPVEQEGESR